MKSNGFSIHRPILFLSVAVNRRYRKDGISGIIVWLSIFKSHGRAIYPEGRISLESILSSILSQSRGPPHRV